MEQARQSIDRAFVVRPSFVDEEHLVYLDRLRDRGVTNMFGAVPHVEAHFMVSNSEARAILAYWMETYGERHQLVGGGGR